MNPLDESRKETQRKKKPYQKPKLRRVELRPEEAVLGACKSNGSTGGGAGGGCSTISCMSQGS